MAARTAADGKWVRRIARTAADVGAREWLETGGEKKPLVMSELGCADGCRRREMGAGRIARTAADGVGAREWLEMGWEGKPLLMSELGCADACGRAMGAEKRADGCGRRGCNGVAGNGWGEEAAGDERAWLRGRLRTASGGENCADGCGREMGAEDCADGCGWRGRKGVGWEEKLLVMSALGCADGCGREMGSRELRGRLRTAVGAREWLEMGGEKKPLVMSKLGCVGAREWLEMGGE